MNQKTKNLKLSGRNDTSGKNTGPLIINQITVTPVRRTSIDVKDWRDAIRSAEADISHRNKLYDMFEDILLDTHLSTEFDKRIQGITNAELVFVNSAGELVPEINDLIDTPEFEDMLAEIMWKVMWGITLLDFSPGTKLFEFASIPRKHIRPVEGIVVEHQQEDTSGIPYRDAPYANWVIEIGKPREFGLLMKVAFWVIIKRGGIGDFAQFAEIFGMPTRIGEYDAFDENSRIELEKAFKEAGSAAYILKPKGTDVTLMENKTNSDGSLYDKLISICDRAISISILGQTLTTIDKSGSGYAQGKIHENTLSGILKADKRYMRRILNREVMRILTNLGYPVKGGKFMFRDNITVDDRIQNMKLIESVKRNGVPVADDYVYEQTGIPKPENYDELKAQADELKKARIESGKKQQPQPGKGKIEKQSDESALVKLYESLMESLSSLRERFFG